MNGRFHFLMTALWSGLLGVGFALGASWLWQAEQEAEAARPPVDILQTRLSHVEGRTVWIEVRAVRHRSCALTATVQWQGGDRIINSRHNPHKTVLAPGERRWVRIRMDLPERLKSGAYQVRSVAEYVCPDGRTFAIPTAWVSVGLES